MPHPFARRTLDIAEEGRQALADRARRGRARGPGTPAPHPAGRPRRTDAARRAARPRPRTGLRRLDRPEARPRARPRPQRRHPRPVRRHGRGAARRLSHRHARGDGAALPLHVAPARLVRHAQLRPARSRQAAERAGRRRRDLAGRRALRSSRASAASTAGRRCARRSPTCRAARRTSPRSRSRRPLRASRGHRARRRHRRSISAACATSPTPTSSRSGAWRGSNASTSSGTSITDAGRRAPARLRRAARGEPRRGRPPATARCVRSPASRTCTRSAAATASPTTASRCCTSGRCSRRGRAARSTSRCWTTTPSPNLLWLRGPFTDRGLEHLRGLDGLFALNLDDAPAGAHRRVPRPAADLPRLASLAVRRQGRLDAGHRAAAGAALPHRPGHHRQRRRLGRAGPLAHHRADLGPALPRPAAARDSSRWPRCRRCAGCPSAA